MLKKIITFVFLLVNQLLISQVNLDFEAGNTSGWTISGAATVMNSGNDGCGGFSRVFSGAYSLMLSNGPIAGNTNGSASQTFLVTQQNACFTYNYAAIIQSPGHGCSCNPKLEVTMSINGSNIPCSHVDVVAGCSNVTGWINSSCGGQYLPWTPASFDLRPYIGSNVTVRFDAVDCCAGGHYGYAYIDCSAQPMGLYLNNTPIPSNQTNSYLCNGISNIVSAPVGFNYLWTGPNATSPVNGATTYSIDATEAGTYSVNLSLTSLACANINLWSSFGFIDTPTANFSVDPVCFGSPTSFTNTSVTPTLNVSLGVSTTYTWNFDDGSPLESVTNPNHLYAGANINTLYNATLTAASQNCITQIVKPVFVGAQPIASFTSNIVCFGTATQIQGNSNGNGNPLADYAIDFNYDGTIDATGTGNPLYTFPYFGDNVVSYTVSTHPAPGLSCYSFTTNNVWVDPKPEAEFSFINNCINAQPNTFDASISSIPVGTNDIFDWNFGDGQAISLNVATTNHVYNSSGTYQVNLLVTSDKGCTNSISHQIEVYAKPNVQIVASPLICLGGTTTFTANTTGNSGNIVTWMWDVNSTPNSKELNGKQTGFVFPTEGLQTINLQAITDYGCQENFTRQVYINYIPKPEFTVDDPDGCPLPHCVVLTDNSTVTAPAKIINWDWNFGNGKSTGSTTNMNQQTCYTNTSSNQLALYTLTLTTKTDSGCVASKTKKDMITVFPKPIANYTVVPEFGNVVVPLVHFVNQSVDYTLFVWNFGDSKSDNTHTNPDHYYEGTTSDDYYSSLIVTNKYGCTDTANVKVNIAPEFVFYIPNAFSPNDDGVNDGFTGTGIGIVKYEMWIIDRWGVTIFYTDDITIPWNGKVQGKEIEAKQDVYTWKVELKDVFDKKHNYVGHVTLLK